MSLLEVNDVQIFLERLGVRDLDLSEHTLQNLTRIVCVFQENLPFQSVSLISAAVEERHVPSLEEVVAKGLALEGGVCFDLNVFMCILLRAVGYQADVLDGSYCASAYRHTHVVVIVHNIRYPGDRHIVDVGTGFPFLEPVPVDELPITHRWAGLEVRYIHDGDCVYRCHRTGDLEELNPVMRGEWRQVFDFSLHPVDYDFFRPHMEHVYVDENIYFLKTIRACRFPRVFCYDTKECEESCQGNSNSNTENEKLESAPNKAIKVSHHLLAIKNNKLLFGPMNNLKKEDIRMDELAAQLKHNFPNLPPFKIRSAVNRYIDLHKS